MYGIFGMELIRKDFLMLFLLMLALHLYRAIRRPLIKLVVVNLVLLFVLNLHEASFFLIGPLWVLLMLCDQGLPYRLPRRLLMCLPPLVMFAVLCMAKGDGATSDAICHSWRFADPVSFAAQTRNSIQAIGWETGHTICFHLMANFGGKSEWLNISYIGLLIRPLAVATMFFLVINLLFPHSASRVCLRRYILILLFLFVSLLPMFTVLSCDFRRVSAYWLLYAVAVYHYTLHLRLRIPLAEKAEQAADFLLSLLRMRTRFLPLLVLCLFSIPYGSNPFGGYVSPSFGLFLSWYRFLFS